MFSGLNTFKSFRVANLYREFLGRALPQDTKIMMPDILFDGDLYIVSLQSFTMQKYKTMWKHASLQTIILLITRWLNSFQGSTN